MSGVEQAVAIATAKKVAEAAALDIYNNTKGVAKKSINALMIEFGAGYSKYLARNYDRCRYVKTLLHRIDPIPIENAYVDPNFKIQQKHISGANFLSELERLKKIVVTGVGGSGKSMFLKRAFLDLCQNPFGRIPLFFELRELNDPANKNLLSCLLTQWSALIPSFTIDRFEYGLRTGKFAILLDGLDEVDYGFRDECCKQLLDLSYKYPDCLFLLTSRPDDRFASWNEFYGAQILPLNEDQVIELITKMEFDEDTKKHFLGQVSSRLFKTHATFLSNPLLCTMMLMTYAEFEEIPSKMYIFYGRAFDALFTRHDKTKTSFRRKFYTDLPEDDFKRLFSTFCLFTFLDRKISFEEADAKKYIGSAVAYEKMAVSPESFLKDLYESVSILLKDGVTFSFLHRSFQEYFVSTFLAERQFPGIDALIGRCCRYGDSVVALLLEMNRDAFESKYFSKHISSLRKQLDKIKLAEEPEIMLSYVYDKVSVRNGELSAIRHANSSGTLQILSDYYAMPTGLLQNLMANLVSIAVIAQQSIVKAGTKMGRDKGMPGAVFDVVNIPSVLLQKTGCVKDLTAIRAHVRSVDKQLRKRSKEKQDFVSDLLRASR